MFFIVNTQGVFVPLWVIGMMIKKIARVNDNHATVIKNQSLYHPFKLIKYRFLTNVHLEPGSILVRKALELVTYRLFLLSFT